MIEINHVSHEYSRRQGGARYLALSDIHLTIDEGTFVSFLGPSGCGKTTMLRIANGLIRPSDGAVRIRGELVKGPAADRAMVFQEFNLLPWRTARGNVEMPLEVQGVSKAERWRITEETLAQVGLEKFADFFPHQLSGGMKQRVGLARALSVNPSYLFMDEPFGALDPQIREIMQIELMKLWDSDTRKTVLFVTHSVDEAVFLVGPCDHVRDPARACDRRSHDLAAATALARRGDDQIQRGVCDLSQADMATAEAAACCRR